VAHAVQNDRAEQQRVARQCEDIGEVERNALSRAGDNERIRHALRRGEQRDEIADCPPARDSRTDCSSIRRHTWNEQHECNDESDHDDENERRTHVMKVRRGQELVYEVDGREGNCRAEENRTSHFHDTQHRTWFKSVRRTTEDLPMGQRRYPECVAREGKLRLRTLEDVVALPRKSPLTPELRRALAAASQLHCLRSDLERVPVRSTATITEAGAYRFRQRDPIDLRVSRVGGRSALGFLHELGHLLDHQIHYDRKSRSWASEVHPAFAPWRAAASLLEKRSLPGGYSRQRYFQSVHEVWARSYAQTVMLRAGDRVLLRRLEKLQTEDDAHVWPAEQFEAVATEVELVFERLGLRQLSLPLAA
jgi:hypothetical protein